MSEVEQAIGHWVEVTTVSMGLPSVYTGGLHEIGLLRDADGEFLYLERPGGESVCIPASAIGELRVLDEPAHDAAAPPDPERRAE